MTEELKETVYPSDEPSVIALFTEDDEYGGAHTYGVKSCYGYKDGRTIYESYYDEYIRFVKGVGEDVQAGLQTEQLLIILKDRHEKLNKVYPSEFHDKFMAGIQMALDALKERVDDRISRNVMGKLEK